MRTIELAAVVLMSIAACNGCAMPTPKQNLDNQLKAMIGKSLDVRRTHLDPELLLGRKDMGNDSSVRLI